MRLKLITVALNPETGEFPTEPLAGVEGEILSVVEHFFHHEGLPHLLLVVHHRVQKETEARKRKRPREDVAETLSAPDRRLFEKLRAWRRGRAEADGVPPYVVLKNRDLAEIAKRRPASLESLREVEGIGAAKGERYGRQILRVVGEDGVAPKALAQAESREAAEAPAPPDKAEGEPHGS